MNEKPTTVNFPADRKKLLRIEAAKRGVTMEALVRDAFDRYVGTPPEDAPKQSRGFSVNEQPWVEYLVKVLRASGPGQQETYAAAIKQNLRAFVRAIDAEGGAPMAPPAGTDKRAPKANSAL